MSACVCVGRGEGRGQADDKFNKQAVMKEEEKQHGGEEE